MAGRWKCVSYLKQDQIIVFSLRKKSVVTPCKYDVLERLSELYDYLTL